MKRPNTVQTALSVASCKLTRAILRKTGRGGTAVPGLVAMKVSERILTAVSDGMKLIVVTGTNGKTTTCNMIEHALTAGGRSCLLDKSGANMLHGIAADLISNASWNGKPKYEYAVLECDEAALKLLVQYVVPDDELDQFSRDLALRLAKKSKWAMRLSQVVAASWLAHMR